jgi:hypothetical protein
VTETLLLVGAAAAVVFLAVLLIEGALRPGYDPIYHTGSELVLVAGVGFRERTSYKRAWECSPSPWASTKP